MRHLCEYNLLARLRDDAAQLAEVVREGGQLVHEALGVHVRGRAQRHAQLRLVPRRRRLRRAQPAPTTTSRPRHNHVTTKSQPRHDSEHVQTVSCSSMLI